MHARSFLDGNSRACWHESFGNGLKRIEGIGSRSQSRVGLRSSGSENQSAACRTGSSGSLL